MNLGFILVIIGTPALSLWAAWRVKRVNRRFSQVPACSVSGGPQMAAAVLEAAGIYDVEIVEHEKMLGDHYDPIHKRLVHSSDNYHSRPVAALGIPAHGCGPAIQHQIARKTLDAAAEICVAAFITPLAHFLWHLVPLLTGTRRE